jgi:hypothetical protein
MLSPAFVQHREEVPGRRGPEAVDQHLHVDSAPRGFDKGVAHPLAGGVRIEHVEEQLHAVLRSGDEVEDGPEPSGAGLDDLEQVAGNLGADRDIGVVRRPCEVVGHPTRCAAAEALTQEAKPLLR